MVTETTIFRLLVWDLGGRCWCNSGGRLATTLCPTTLALSRAGACFKNFYTGQPAPDYPALNLRPHEMMSAGGQTRHLARCMPFVVSSWDCDLRAHGRRSSLVQQKRPRRHTSRSEARDDYL